MPTITRSTPTAWHIDVAPAEGPDGQILSNFLQDVYYHWQKSLQLSDFFYPMSSPPRTSSYNPGAPLRSFLQLTQFKVRGKGTPLPYPLEDE